MFRWVVLLTLAWALTPGGAGYAQERGWATAIAWSPDGETIAVGSSTGVWFFDTEFNETGYVPTPQLDGYPPTTLDWNASSEMIAVANAYQRGGILVVDVAAESVVRHIKRAILSNVRWHPAEDVVMAAAWADDVFGIIAWDARTAEKIHLFSQLAYPENNMFSYDWAVCWLSNDQVAAIGRYITVFDIVRGARLNSLETSTLSLRSHAGIDCYGRDRLVSAKSGILDLNTGETIRTETAAITFYDYDQKFIDVAWAPDGKRYLTNGNVGLCRIAVFDGQTSALLAELQGSFSREHDLSTYSESITWRPQGDRFAVVGQFDIRVWDAQSYELVRRYDGFEVGYHYRTDPNSEFAESDRLEEMLTYGTKCPGVR